MIKRFRHYVRENMMDNPYGNIKPRYNKKLKVAVVEPDEWYESPLDWYYGECINIVPLSRRFNVQNGNIDYNDISQFDTIDEVVRYVKRTSKCREIYGIERYEHGLVRYSLLNIGDSLSDRWDSALVGLIYSPKGNNHCNKEQISEFLDLLTDWANGTNMYRYKLYEVYEDKLKDAIDDDFDDYDIVDSIGGCYCQDEKEIFKEIDFNPDVVIFSDDMYSPGVYDNNGNELQL